MAQRIGCRLVLEVLEKVHACLQCERSLFTEGMAAALEWALVTGGIDLPPDLRIETTRIAAKQAAGLTSEQAQGHQVGFVALLTWLMHESACDPIVHGRRTRGHPARTNRSLRRCRYPVKTRG